jgi:type 2 lantibiotic biosynthesis protein LanM
MRIGILPKPRSSRNNIATFDISAIGASVNQQAPYTVVGIDNFGRDDIRITHIPGWIPSVHNRPDPNNTRDIPGSSILTGFLKSYDIFLINKATLLRSNSVIGLFKSKRRRLIVRDTVRYGGLQADEFHPDLLRDALDRAWHWDNLWNESLRRPIIERFYYSELSQLLQYDIPHFTMQVDGNIAMDSNEISIDLQDVISGWEASQFKLRSLSHADREQQAWYIIASLGIPQERGFGKAIETDNDFSCNRHLDLAVSVGNKVLQRLVFYKDFASFANISSVMGENASNSNAFSIYDSDNALYDGRAGVALFLAYLSRESKDNKYRDAAKALINNIETERTESSSLPGIGGFTGIPSLIYVYSHLYALWRDKSLLLITEKLIKQASKLIESDKNLDILDGAAGCLLAALSFHHVSRSRAALALAKRCARHLTEIDQSGDPRWKSIATKRGLSHGLSGIALALGKLGVVLSEDKLKIVSQEIFDMESTFIADGNWTDSHQLFGRPQVSWCHGAPGIALARLGMSGSLLGDLNNRDIELALKETISHFRIPSHCLCHGTFGNIEPLVYASKYSKFNSHTDDLEKIINEVLDEFTESGFKSLLANQTLGLGLMTGLSGVGYGLLRLHAERSIPSVLLLESPQFTSGDGIFKRHHSMVEHFANKFREFI